ncbi:MAG: DEAD/DEAH box helicase [Crocinitomicaceae bacterium]|nr:DEAD/DEAH box helicase [Crocinitomicaceae bacterium]
MKFEDYKISPKIKSQLKELGYNKPTDIQFKAIDPILKGEDVLAIAQTGTGKTAAFVIPILQKLDQQHVNNKQRVEGVKCLVLAPTRELAIQISKVFQAIGEKLPVVSACIHGGVEQDPQISKLNSGVDILVATPGRMFDLVSQGHLNLKNLEILCLDEADLMLDLGFYKDIEDLLKFIPKKRQTLFFSATITLKIKKLAYSVVNNAIRIQISPKNPVAKNIDHAVVFIEMDDKRFFLENVLKEYDDKKFVVFVRTKVRAERVVAAMERVQVKTEFLHGGVEQQERFKILDRFRTNENRVLITTDVAARGIDIPDVDYVINYDLPDVSENYVHRVGRTGRGMKRGQALSFCSKDELVFLKDIEEYTGEDIQQFELTNGEYEDILGATEDGSNNWKKLIDDAEKDNGNEW